MRVKILYLSLMFLHFWLVSCCIIKTRFNKEEFKWLKVYNAGDTLIFQSEYGNLDTTWIVEKSIGYPECASPNIHDIYLPQYGKIYYFNTMFENTQSNPMMISMNKYSYATTLTISYLNSTLLFADIYSSGSLRCDKLIWEFREGDIYIFDASHPNAKQNEPKTLYWQEDHGIVKYITHDGVEWKRINLDFEVE